MAGEFGWWPKRKAAELKAAEGNGTSLIAEKEEARGEEAPERRFQTTVCGRFIEDPYSPRVREGESW